jgi:hypothetical protein
MINRFDRTPALKQTITATVNPANGLVTSTTVTNTNHDMFCPGISMLGNGDIVVTGGDVAEKTSIYSAKEDAWVPGPDMNIPRGYQSSVTLSNGEVCSSHLCPPMEAFSWLPVLCKSFPW